MGSKWLFSILAIFMFLITIISASAVNVATCADLNTQLTADEDITLTADIDCAVHSWTAVTGYASELNGANYTIYNFYYVGDDTAGLIAIPGNGARVNNLCLDNATIQSGIRVGGIYGWIVNTGDTATINQVCVVNSHLSITRTLGGAIGGLVGDSEGDAADVSDCYVRNTTIQARKSYGDGGPGGIVGYNGRAADYTSCYSADNIILDLDATLAGGFVSEDYSSYGGYIINSFATNNYIGNATHQFYEQSSAFIATGSQLTNCYYGNSTGHTDGYATGNFSDSFNNMGNEPLDTWDFTDVWKVGENYPIFQWQTEAAPPSYSPPIFEYLTKNNSQISYGGSIQFNYAFYSPNYTAVNMSDVFLTIWNSSNSWITNVSTSCGFGGAYNCSVSYNWDSTTRPIGKYHYYTYGIDTNAGRTNSTLGYFNITVVDNPPTYSDIWSTSPIYLGENYTVGVKWTDDTGLNATYYFSTNQTSPTDGSDTGGTGLTYYFNVSTEDIFANILNWRKPGNKTVQWDFTAFDIASNSNTTYNILVNITDRYPTEYIPSAFVYNNTGPYYVGDSISGYQYFRDDSNLSTYNLTWYNSTHTITSTTGIVQPSVAYPRVWRNIAGAGGVLLTNYGSWSVKVCMNDTYDQWACGTLWNFTVVSSNTLWYDYGANATNISLGNGAILYSNWTTPSGSLTYFKLNEQLPNGTWYLANTSAWAPFVCGNYSDCAVEVLSNRSMFPVGQHNFTFMANNSVFGTNETPVFSVVVEENSPTITSSWQVPDSIEVNGDMVGYVWARDTYNLSGWYPSLWNGSEWIYGEAYWQDADTFSAYNDYGYTGRFIDGYLAINFGLDTDTYGGYIGEWKWKMSFNNSLDNWVETPESSFYVKAPLTEATAYEWDSTSGYGYFSDENYYWQDAMNGYNSATRGITDIEVIPVAYDMNHDGVTEILIIDDNELRVFSGTELNNDNNFILFGENFKHFAIVQNLTETEVTSYITIAEDDGNVQLNKIDFYWNGSYNFDVVDMTATLTNYEGGQMVFQCDTGKCVIVYNERPHMDYAGGVPVTSNELWATEWSEATGVLSPTMIFNSTNGGVLCLPRYRNMEIVDYMHNGSIRTIFPFIDSDDNKFRVVEMDNLFTITRNGTGVIGDAVEKTDRVYCEYNATADADHSDIGRMATNIIVSNFDTDDIEEYVVGFVTTDYGDDADDQDFIFYMWNGSLASSNNYDDGVLLKTDNNGIPGNLFIASPNVASEVASENMAVCTLGNRGGDIYGGVLCFSPYYEFTPESTQKHFSLFRPGATYYPGTWMDYGFSGQHRYTQLLTDGTQNYTGGVNPTEFILTGEPDVAGIWDIAYIAADNGMTQRYTFGDYTFVLPVLDANTDKTDFVTFDATNMYYFDDLYYDNPAGLNKACFNPCIYYPSGTQTWVAKDSQMYITLNATDLNSMDSINTSSLDYPLLYVYMHEVVTLELWYLNNPWIAPLPVSFMSAMGWIHIPEYTTDDFILKNYYITYFSEKYSSRVIVNYSVAGEVATNWSDYQFPLENTYHNITLDEAGIHQIILQVKDVRNGTITNVTYPVRVGLPTEYVTVEYGDCQFCSEDFTAEVETEEAIVNNTITQAMEDAESMTGLPIKVLWLLLMAFIGVVIWVNGGKAEPGLSVGIVIIVEIMLLIAGWKFQLISPWIMGLIALFGLIIGGMFFTNKVMKK